MKDFKDFGFAGMIDAPWGYDKKKRTTSKKVMNKHRAIHLRTRLPASRRPG
jgi:hypothetical protein